MAGTAPALTLEDSSVLDDEEFQLHAGRLQQLLHVPAGSRLVLLLHLPGAAGGGALGDTYLQISPWREHRESRQFMLGGGIRRENQLKGLGWAQSPFGQIDEDSGICPERAAWPKERTEKVDCWIAEQWPPQSCAWLPAQCLLQLPHRDVLVLSRAIPSLTLLSPACPQQ